MKERHKLRYILLDRDGTVIIEKHYLSDPAQVELLPGAVEGMRLLRDAGFGMVLVTNQSGIGRGYFTLEDLGRVHQRLVALLREGGVELAGIYVCPHAPDQECECRKPKAKLAQDAARDLGFGLELSWVIGDKAADVWLARNCGAGSILVRTGYGAETEMQGGVSPSFVANDLLDAARWITGG